MFRATIIPIYEFGSSQEKENGAWFVIIASLIVQRVVQMTKQHLVMVTTPQIWRRCCESSCNIRTNLRRSGLAARTPPKSICPPSRTRWRHTHACSGPMKALGLLSQDFLQIQWRTPFRIICAPTDYDHSALHYIYLGAISRHTGNLLSTGARLQWGEALSCG